MSQQSAATQGGEEVCWVCLSGPDEPLPGFSASEELQLLCACPRPVHPTCLARWQLQSAGQDEEIKCRFCQGPLPDWRNILTPHELPPASKAPVMAINVDGKEHKLRVRPGPEGREAFKRDVKRLLGFPDDADLNVVFECKAPNTDEIVQLNGFAAFDAAAHCASVAAARRQARHAARAQRHRAQQLAKQQAAAAAATMHDLGACSGAGAAADAPAGADPIAAREAMAANLLPLRGVAGLSSQGSGLSPNGSTDSIGSIGSLTSSGSLGSADYSAVLSAAAGTSAPGAGAGAQGCGGEAQVASEGGKPSISMAAVSGQAATGSSSSSSSSSRQVLGHRGVQLWRAQQQQQQQEQQGQQQQEEGNASASAAGAATGRTAKGLGVARRWMEALLPQLSL